MRKIVASLSLMTALFCGWNSNVSAADRDIYDKGTNQSYSYSVYINDDNAFNSLLDKLDADPNRYIFEFGGKGYIYSVLLEHYNAAPAGTSLPAVLSQTPETSLPTPSPEFLEVMSVD